MERLVLPWPHSWRRQQCEERAVGWNGSRMSAHGPFADPLLLDVDAVEVVAAEPGVALWTLALPRLVPGLDAFDAEDVEALGQHRILVVHVAARAAELCLGMQDAASEKNGAFPFVFA